MYSKGSHTMRLIIGIISIVLCLIILIQSCAAGIGNAIADNGEAGGTGGLILSIFMLISGIIAIAARKSKGGTITSTVFYAVGAVIAFASAGSYKVQEKPHLKMKLWLCVSSAEISGRFNFVYNFYGGDISEN